MDKRLFLLSVVAVLLSFAGGFLLANSLNKNELGGLRAENESLKREQSDAAETAEKGTLSDEEIRAKILEADRSPDNISLQKNLGLALYSYASTKQNSDLLREVSRLITRVYEKKSDDYEAVVALGNINFDIGYFEKNNESLEKAREFYQRALAKKSDDADVITDLGLTYFLSSPPETEKAVAEFEKSLKANPKSVRTLEVLIETLQSVNKKEEAEKYSAQLKEINLASASLSNANSSPEIKESGAPKQ